MVAIMHSVAPQQTVTFLSGSHGMPLKLRTLAAIASRRAGAPQVMAYWLYPSWMARHAASLIAWGASKSGIPWPRLIAPCRAASRVISRITDSEKCPTRAARFMDSDLGSWALG